MGCGIWDIDIVIRDIDVRYRISIWSSCISIWDILSLLPVLSTISSLAPAAANMDSVSADERRALSSVHVSPSDPRRILTLLSTVPQGALAYYMAS